MSTSQEINQQIGNRLGNPTQTEDLSRAWIQSSPEDWHKTIIQADAQGVAPLLYWKFTQTGWPEGIPEAEVLALTRSYYASYARNTLLLGELERVLELLLEQHIPTVLIKGAALATTLYADIGLRPMADLDLLFRPADYKRALQVIKGRLGYTEFELEAVPGLGQVKDYHTHLVGGPGRKVDLELHWDLVVNASSWYAAPFEWFWQRSLPFHGKLSLEEGERGENGDLISSLTPEAHLLYLAAHSMLQHGESQSFLIWSYDIHALTRAFRDKIDWDLLVSQAHELGWSPVLAAALEQACQYFHTAVPDSVFTALYDEKERKVARLVALKKEFSGVRLIYDWYTLISLRWPERMRFLSALVFPSREYIRWRYQPRPSWTWPFYYIYRWLRIPWESAIALRKGIIRLN